MAVGYTAGQQGQTSPGLALVDAQEDAENAPKGEVSMPQTVGSGQCRG